MAVQKKPVYVFETDSDTGIDQVPLKRLVLVERIGTTSPVIRLFLLRNKNGVDSNTTIAQAIANKNLVVFWNENNDGYNSELVAQDSQRWKSHKLLNISTDEPTSNDGEEGDIWFQYED